MADVLHNSFPRPQVVAGVYRIRNTVNGKVYIGSSVDVHRRLRQHRECLNAGHHDNRYLQLAFNKYGETAFAFEPLDDVASFLVPPSREEKCALADNLLFWEQVYIDNYISGGRDACYNLSPTAGNTIGFRFGDDSRAKISEKAKGRPTWNKGATKDSDPRVAAYAAKRIGYRFSEEDREKLRRRPSHPAWNRGKKGCWKAPPEWVEANRRRMRGHKFSAERNERIRNALIGRVHSAEHRARLKEAQNRPETRARRCRSLRLYYARATVVEWT